MSEKRAKNGQFAKGNAGGPGRPKKEREREYLNATVSCVSVAQWKRIVKKAAKDAEKGDAVARNWLGNYLLGTPLKRIDLSGSIGVHDDLAEWKKKRQEQLDAVAAMDEPERAP